MRARASGLEPTTAVSKTAVRPKLIFPELRSFQEPEIWKLSRNGIERDADLIRFHGESLFLLPISVTAISAGSCARRHTID